ncbi:MAG: histidine triad nucleotide-binding protein [Nitrospinae bacterium]|nr:histidine triad nucleotide-binding protein [Nitrospinota bacterium]
MSDGCIFCDIVAGRKPAVNVYEDEALLAIEDMYPRAPVHLLLMPKRHVPTLLDIQADDAAWVGAIPFVANRLARERGIADSGYRLVVNVNRGGGQAIFHVHFHLLGGRPLRWPP